MLLGCCCAQGSEGRRLWHALPALLRCVLAGAAPPAPRHVPSLANQRARARLPLLSPCRSARSRCAPAARAAAPATATKRWRRCCWPWASSERGRGHAPRAGRACPPLAAHHLRVGAHPALDSPWHKKQFALGRAAPRPPPDARRQRMCCPRSGARPAPHSPRAAAPSHLSQQQTTQAAPGARIRNSHTLARAGRTPQRTTQCANNFFPSGTELHKPFLPSGQAEKNVCPPWPALAPPLPSRSFPVP